MRRWETSTHDAKLRLTLGTGPARGGLVLSRTCRPGFGCSNCGSDGVAGFSVGST